MRFESNSATRRLRQSKRRSALGIPTFKGYAWLSRTGRRSCGSSKTSNAACGEAAIGKLCGNAGRVLLQEVRNLVGDAVVAVDSASPDLVRVRADPRIFSALDAAHPAAQVALGDLLRLVDRAGDCDRLVVPFLVLGDQHRQAQFGVGLQRERKSVVTRGLLLGSCHLVRLLA